jgi:hypothetical protein
MMIGGAGGARVCAAVPGLMAVLGHPRPLLHPSNAAQATSPTRKHQRAHISPHHRPRHGPVVRADMRPLVFAGWRGCLRGVGGMQ